MFDNISMKHRVEQFDIKHGADDAVKSADGTFWLFPDGARREVNLFGSLQEPPDPNDEYELNRTRRTREQVELMLLQRQQDYHAARLVRLTQDFKNRKQQMLAGHYGDEELTELNKLAKTVQACRHELGMIEEEVRKRSPRDRAREMHAFAEQQRQQRIDAVKSINI